MVGVKFWRPKAGGVGGFCWVILLVRFAIGGSIWGGKFVLELLRFEGEVKELLLLLVDGRLEAGLEFDV